MNFEMLTQNVLNWADDKGILENSDPKSQLLKTVSEVGELADAVNKGQIAEFEDAMGDVLVTLIILNHLYQGGSAVTLEDCLESAYNVISKRTGKMTGGVFVKD